MTKKEECTCGNTGETYHHDENQWEPNCWDCWSSQREEMLRDYDDIDITPLSYIPDEDDEEDELPF